MYISLHTCIVSWAPSIAALVRKVQVVSKLICRYGDGQSFMPARFIAEKVPLRVMKSAINLKCRAFTLMP